MKVILVSCCLIGFFLLSTMLARATEYAQDSTPSKLTGWNIKIPTKRELKKRLKPIYGMQLIQGGSFSTNEPDKRIDRRPENDSTLILDFETGKRLSIASFYLAQKEVSNSEYRKFVDWVIDSIALTILAERDPTYYLDPTIKTLNWSRRSEVRDTTQFKYLYPLFVPNPYSNMGTSTQHAYVLNVSAIQYRYYEYSPFFSKSNYSQKPTILAIYPDTLCWMRDLPAEYNESLTKHYFQHPAYNKHPVVGVSWNQANAYCDWLRRDGKFAYRLPTQAEILYCHVSIPKGDGKNKLKPRKIKKPVLNSHKAYTYPWPFISEKLTDKNGKYLANSGSITDEYGITHKGYADDGALYTSACGSYPPSPQGLYDLAGNVAEWVDHGFDKKLVIENEFSTSRYRYYSDNYTPLILDSIVLRLFNFYRTQSAQEKWISLGKPMMIPKPYDMITGPDAELYKILLTANNVLSNYQILNQLDEPRMVVGGSWLESPSMMRFGEKRAYAADATHSFIGFRVAASVTEN